MPILRFHENDHTKVANYYQNFKKSRDIAAAFCITFGGILLFYTSISIPSKQGVMPEGARRLTSVSWSVCRVFAI